MPALQKWTLSLLATGVVVAVSFAWLDQPIAFFAHTHLVQAPAFAQLTLLPEPLEPLSLITLLLLGIMALAGRKFGRPENVALTCAVSLIVAESVKNELKYVFGRTWPETWINGNPSLIHDNAYGFNFFHGGAGYASFPSGHTTAICAVASVLWICYPRLRILYVAAFAAVVIGLIGADYHFLSDIIAGAFVGTSTGWFAVLLRGNEKIAPPSIHSPQ
jgi:membrane-associated phospholipid phosphatase